MSCGNERQETELLDFSQPQGPYFWKAEKDGKTSYFLGTFHHGVSLEELQCSQKIESYLKNSDYFFTEEGINLQEGDTTEEGDFNKIFLSENNQDFQSLNDNSKIFLSSRGVSEEFSYLGYVYIMENLCRAQAIGSGSVSIDLQVKAIAKLNNIPIENLDEDIDIKAVSDAQLSTYTYTYTNEAIDNNLINRKVLEFEKCILSHIYLLEQYKVGSIEMNNLSDEFDKIILRDRNKQWFIKFKNAHKTFDHIFLASGVGHFIGNFNLLDMLKKDGFSISRMNTSCNL